MKQTVLQNVLSTLNSETPPQKFSRKKKHIDLSNILTEKKEDIRKYYTFHESIGKGTQGKVFKAIRKLTNQLCAIKLMKKNQSFTEKSLEFKILRKLDHPNIGKIIEFFNYQGNFYLVLKYYAFGDLKCNIIKKGFIPEQSTKNAMFQVLSAISYLQRHDCIHSDLQPQNILIGGNTNDYDH